MYHSIEKIYHSTKYTDISFMGQARAPGPGRASAQGCWGGAGGKEGGGEQPWAEARPRSGAKDISVYFVE